MRVTRIYTGPDGRSHFEDLEIALGDVGPGLTRVDPEGSKSKLQPATGVVFRETSGSYDYGFHNAPRRQYIVNLDGEVEVELGDGTKRIFRTGDVLLAEDTTGEGHISRAVGGKPRRSLIITLD